MTPALKAMVEAMASEMEDQIEAMKVNGAWASFVDGRFFASGEHGGYFDLEKVARAGLEAIREPVPIGLVLAGLEMDDSVGVWWPRLVDAILAPTTGEGNG